MTMFAVCSVVFVAVVARGAWAAGARLERISQERQAYSAARGDL